MAEPQHDEDKSKQKMEKKRLEMGVERYRDLINHPSLYREASNRNWKSVRRFVRQNPNSWFAPISNRLATLIHVAAATKEPEAVKLLGKLVDLEDRRSLEETDLNGMTTLHYAAASGNAKAAEILLKKNPNLSNIKDDDGHAPLYYAAKSGQADAVNVLLPKNGPTSGEDPIDIDLVDQLITTNLFGIALQLIMNRTLDGEALKVLFNKLATKDRAFRSGRQLRFWQEFVYKCAPIERRVFCPCNYEKSDVENLSESSENAEDRVGSAFLLNVFNGFGTVLRNVHVVIWKVIKQLAPSVRKIDEEILKHKQAEQLLKHLCKKFESSEHGYEDPEEILKMPVLEAAKRGIHEFVDEVLKTYPDSFMFFDEENRNVLQLAILHRREEVFVGIMEKSNSSEISILRDREDNNVLYYASQLKASVHLPSAALRMQKEIQWFKVLEDLVHPSLLEAQNPCRYSPSEESYSPSEESYSPSDESYSPSDELYSPWEEFIERHYTLLKQGAEWMKNTASSCTVVATLITTVVFAAAFTVPGGINENNGTPLFLEHSSILTFLVADTLALISSSTSILMFLGILTSHYSAIDFMEYLPRKLMFGLIALFFSIASMIIAFGAAIHIVLFRRFKWVDIPFSLIAFFPVILFVWLQLPLLIDIYTSTYCSKICRLKRS